MTEPFFSRWSQRKQALAKGLPVEDPAAAPKTTPPARAAGAGAAAGAAAAAATAGPAGSLGSAGVPPSLATDSAQGSPALPADGGGQNPNSDAAEAPPSLPTLDDARALTPKSDFQPFMRHGVASDVRNAAVKKLFADPHFNIMDGLDIYIGDYNTPDPLPAGMLKKMVGAQFLNLFPDAAKAASTPGLGAATPLPSAPSTKDADETLAPRANPEQSPATPESPKDVSQSQTSLPTPQTQPTTALNVPVPSPHDHPDLQLQPNHAPASPSPGPSTG